MAVTQVDIVNGALIKIGTARIAAMSDQSEPARIASSVFTRVARAEMRRHAWSFAMKRAALPALLATPTFGYRTAYNLPADWLRMVQLGEDYVFSSLADAITTNDAPYAIEGKQLLTQDSGSQNIRYIADMAATPDIWDATFVEAFACRLAQEMAPSLTKSSTRTDRLKLDYREAIADARRSNAIELPPRMVADDSWLTARYTW